MEPGVYLSTEQIIAEKKALHRERMRLRMAILSKDKEHSADPSAKDHYKERFSNICAQLKREFEQRYQGRFEFEPEQVDEGGIEMTAWPEKQSSKEYRTIRFLGNRHWPGVEDLDSWKDSDDTTIAKDSKLEILRKALDGVVPWKPVEIKILKIFLATMVLKKIFEPRVAMSNN
ncbi:hypothetical protein BASA81_002070 [Batrachochytrium salamandrivorans]|nr:hypothetical protein BASA81_002070 [Batrachochytrium salamandrivorans]